MNKKIILLILFLITSANNLNAGTARQNLLRDGFVLRGIDGTLNGPDSNDVWFFELASDVVDKDTAVKAGTKLELLPSSTLEMMIAHAKTHKPATYQLWNCTVTKYKDRNYIYPTYFLPINIENEKSEPNEISSEVTPEQDFNDNNANDLPSIPPDIMKKIEAAREETFKTSRRIPDSNIISIDNSQQITKKIKTAIVDSVLVNRAAVLIIQDTDKYEFVLDSIGRNIQKESFRLLPCEELERAEQKQLANPETMRFNIAGILTKYKGNNYLLLTKATQIYSYGNFGR